MKYATWILDFSDPKYGTGPEENILAQGFSAQAFIANGDVNEGAQILGHFEGEPTDLEPWNFTEITQQEALEFAQAIEPKAYVADDGKINVDFDLESGE